MISFGLKCVQGAFGESAFVELDEIFYTVQEVPVFCDSWFQKVIMKCRDHEFQGLFLV